MLSSLKKLLIAVPIMFAIAMIHVFICFSCGGVVALQLNLMGVDKTLGLAAAISTAVGVHTFIVMYDRIRNLMGSLMPGDGK